MPSKPTPEELAFAEAEKKRVDDAMTECLRIIQAADLCAHLVIVGRDHMNVQTDVNATWSRMEMSLDDEGHVVAVRLKSKLSDYGGDVERQRADLQWTVGAAHAFAVALGGDGLGWIETSRDFARSVDVEHSEPTLTPYRAPKS